MSTFLFISSVFILFLVPFIIIHISYVISIGGYTEYIRDIRLLKSFKSVDYKVSSVNSVNDSTNNLNIFRNGILQTGKYTSAFYFKDFYNVIKVYTSDIFGDIDTAINISEETFNHTRKVWEREDYEIFLGRDLIQAFYYKRTIRKFKKANTIKLNQKDDLYDFVDKSKVKKLRLNNIDSLLND